MKKCLFLSMLGMMVMLCGSAFAEDIIWQEDFSSFANGEVPADGDNSYACVGSGTKIYTQNLAGGESPELLVGKSGGSFSAKIKLGGKSGDMKLTFKCNKNISVLCNELFSDRSGYFPSCSSAGNDYTYPFTVPAGVEEITIIFKQEGKDNARLDNIKVYQESSPANTEITDVNVGGRIQLTNDMFYTYDGFGADAQRTGKYVPQDGFIDFGTAVSCPFGDTNSNAWIDCTKYSKLYIKMAGCDAEGNLNATNPRVFINRLEPEGQFNANKPDAKCLVIPNDGTWAEDYYTKEGDDTWVVNLTKIKKDFGFCHLHSIKGSAWNTKAIVYSVEVEEADESEQVGWVSYIHNGSFDESDDVSSFAMSTNATVNEGVQEVEIIEEAGQFGSRAIVIQSMEGAPEVWSTQFFIKLNKFLPEGTHWRFSMQARAEMDAYVTSSLQGNPREWKSGGIVPDFYLNGDWQTITVEGVVTAEQADKGFGCFAFDLNNNKDESNIFYFDNIQFEVYKVGTKAEYASNFVLLDFGFPTNIPELVAKTGKSRLLFPTSCVKVKHGEDSFEIQEVSAFSDGRFYIFIDGEDAISDWLDWGEKVTVNFTNPADEQFHLVYADGNMKGQDVKDFEGTANENEELVTVADAIPYSLIRPTLVAANPEAGSFNLPNSIKEFKVTFDKPTQGDKLIAKLGNINLTVSPKALAEEFTLTREGDDLATGEYTITLSNIHPEQTRAEGGEISYKFGVGHVEVDPNDVTKTYIPLSYFENCSANGVPEGFKLYADGEPAELRQPGTSYFGGARVMEFAAGGDFTKGLYMRTWYCEYGTTDGYALDFTAGKTYNISFNAANWSSGNRYLNFQIFKEADLELETPTPVFSQVVSCAPALGEKRDPVKGSTKTKISFISEETANYVMRWVVASDANGTATNNAWQNGVILANVEVTYMPNVPGMASVLLLNEALTNAKKVQEGNTAERYAGEAFTTLSNAITKYEAEAQSYTSPSDYEAAAAALDAAASAMQDHHLLCDNFDAMLSQGQNIVWQNSSNKFAATELYQTLRDIVNRYQVPADSLSGDGTSYIGLTDDKELQTVTELLTEVVTKAKLMFTIGKSNIGGYTINGSYGYYYGTGVAVLTERLRLGAEALQTLGVSENSEIIQSIDNALTDDDELAERVKLQLKQRVYNEVINNRDFFEPTIEIDPETLEETWTEKQIDMTAFVKNPNIYVTEGSQYNSQTVPGWVVPEGYNTPGLTFGWSDPRYTSSSGLFDAVPADAVFQTWGSGYRVQQTITDLPAGVYTIKMGYGERNDEWYDETYAFASTSDYIYTETAVDEVTLEEISKEVMDFAGIEGANIIGQRFPSAEENGDGSVTIEKIEVRDGKLVIGVNASYGSHTFFNDVRIYMTRPLDDFDYQAALEEIGIVEEDTLAIKQYLQNAIQYAEAALDSMIIADLHETTGLRAMVDSAQVLLNTEDAELKTMQQSGKMLYEETDRLVSLSNMYYELASNLNNLELVIANGPEADAATIADATSFITNTRASLTARELTDKDCYRLIEECNTYYRLMSMVTLTINVQEPGTLESLVYNIVNDPSMVAGLTVSGSLNSIDVRFIAQSMTSLLKLDMSETDVTTLSTRFYATSLKTLVLPKNLDRISGKSAFRNMQSLTNIEFPNTLKLIGPYAFQDCSSLKKVVLPEGLTTLESNAFAYCTSLTEVVLPSTLTSISSPFYGCKNLTSITFNAAEVPSTYNYVMDGSSESNCTLYVPAELYEDFLNDKYWNLFNIQPIGSANNLRVTNEKWINTNDTIYQNTIPAINVTMRDRGDNYWTMDRYQYGALYTEGESMLSASQFSMYFDPYMKLQQQWNGYQGVRTSAVLINNAPMRADSVSATLRLPANRWSFLSLPFDVKVSEIAWKSAGQPFVIYKYDGKRRADGDMNNTWVRMTADSTLHAGIGYIWQTADDVMTGNDYTTCTVTALNNTSKNNIFVRENVDVQLTEYLSELPQNRSWNLVGNPYPAYYETRAMDYTSPFIAWNIADQNYVAYSPVDDDYILMPGEAIFFQRPVDQAAITFLKDGRQVADWQNWRNYFGANVNDSIYGARQSDMRAQRSVFNLTVTGNEMTDRTRFVINDDARLSYEMDKDASKFAGMNAKGVQLYTVEQGVRMAINERPISNGEVRLGMTIGTKGTYTLKVDTKVDNEVYVLDRLTGMETLLGEEGYTFEAEAGTTDNRFVVRLGAGELTGIRSIENSELRMENYYNLKGQKVNKAQKGLYINANGKKVVVK